MNKAKLWTKDFLMNSLAMFIVMLVYYQLMSIMAVYVMDSLQTSASSAGLIAGIFIVAALIARIISGKFIEQIGRKKLLYIGLTVYTLATLLYFVAMNIQVLFIIRVLHGLGFGMATTAAMTIVANIIPRSRRGEGMGYFMLSTTLASAIGPSLGIYLYDHSSFSMILSLSLLLLGVGYFAAFLLKVEEVELTKEQLADMKSFKFNKIFEVNVLPMAMVGLIVFFGYSSIIGFLSSYVNEINLISAGSVFFIVYSMAMLVSRPLTGRWFDTKGENFVMYPSFISFALGLFIISQAQQGFTILLAAVFLGIGFGTFTSCGQAIAIKLVPEHRMGIATSTFVAISEMGIGMGPFFLGFLIPTVGFRGLYVTMGIIVLLAMCLYYFVHGRKVSYNEEVVGS